MPQDMQEIKHLVTTVLEHLNTDENSQVVELPEGLPMDIAWKEGIEDLGMVTKDNLWTYLGFAAEQKLPCF